MIKIKAMDMSNWERDKKKGIRIEFEKKWILKFCGLDVMWITIQMCFQS